jgi:glycosyltransferase involved in cell wall biosynthesis
VNILLISSVLNYRTLVGALSKHRVHQLLPEGELKQMAVEMKELDRLSPEYGKNLVLHTIRRFFLLGYLLKAHQIIRNEKIDLMWTTSPPHGVVCRILKWLLKKPYVILVGQPFTEYIKQERPFYYRIFLPAYELMMQVAFRNADAVITHSRYLQNYVRKYGARHVVATYYYGVDTETFKPVKTARREKYTIMYAGRFSVQKGAGHLIDALGILKEKGLDFEAWMYGQGPLKDYLRSFAEEKKLQFQLNDYVDHKTLASRINQADVFVVPSLSEGLGFMAAEALACGVPVIASNVGGLPDIVEGCGILVPPGDPKALADAIMEVNRNYGVYKKKALEGRKHIVEHFDVKRVVVEFQSALAGAAMG